MKEFIKAYNELIFDENKIKLEYISLNIFNILNKGVENPHTSIETLKNF